MAFTGSKLTIRALEQGVKYVQELKQTISLQIFLRHPPGVFIVNFEHISYLVLLFLLLTLNLQLPAGRNWIFTKTFTDKPLQQTLSWIYSCIIHCIKWCVDNTDIVQMVCRIWLRTKRYHWTYACFCSQNFWSKFHLKRVMCRSHLLPIERYEPVSASKIPAVYCVNLKAHSQV